MTTTSDLCRGEAVSCGAATSSKSYIVHLGVRPLCGLEGPPSSWPSHPVFHGQVPPENASSIGESERCPKCFEVLGRIRRAAEP